MALAAVCLYPLPVPPRIRHRRIYRRQDIQLVRLSSAERRRHVLVPRVRSMSRGRTSHLLLLLGPDGAIEKRGTRRSKSANPLHRIRVHHLVRPRLGRSGLVATAISLVSEVKDTNSRKGDGAAFALATPRGGPRPPFFRWWSRRRSCPPRGRRRRGPSTAHHREISPRAQSISSREQELRGTRKLV